jgi:hypothetical protein
VLTDDDSVSFKEKMQLVIDAIDRPIYIPPPRASALVGPASLVALAYAVFSVKMQLAMVTREYVMCMPPPSDMEETVLGIEPMTTDEDLPLVIVNPSMVIS